MREQYRHGEWFLWRRRSNGVWYRCRHVKAKRNVQRISLCTADDSEAKERFDEWWFEAHRPVQAATDDVTLARVLTVYYSEHAIKKASGNAAYIHIRHALDHWGDAVLADLTPTRQTQWQAKLREEGKSPTYIRRMMTTILAAINRSWRQGMIATTVPVLMPDTSEQVSPAKGRSLEPQELARLFDAMESDSVRRFTLILLGTYCRPGAAFDLRGEQIDRRLGLIDLNPPARAQNKKHRPVVKLPHFLATHFASLPDCHYAVTNAEWRQASVKKAWGASVYRANLAGKVTPYSIRHTGGSWLRQQNVSPWEAAGQMGHRVPGAATTERYYAPHSPDYLHEALIAVEALYTAVLEHSAWLQAEAEQRCNVVGIHG